MEQFVVQLNTAVPDALEVLAAFFREV